MPNIRDLILFYSQYSKRCRDVFTLIERYRIPVSYISVDSALARKIVKSSDNMKITGVPSIIVVYDNGEAEIYEGYKVIEYLQQMIRPVEPTEGNPEQEPRRRPSRQREPDPIDEMDPGSERDEPFEDYDGETIEEETSSGGGGGGGGSARPKNAKERGMSDIKALAQQMEQQRKSMMGGRDGDS